MTDKLTIPMTRHEAIAIADALAENLSWNRDRVAAMVEGKDEDEWTQANVDAVEAIESIESILYRIEHSLYNEGTTP